MSSIDYGIIEPISLTPQIRIRYTTINSFVTIFKSSFIIFNNTFNGCDDGYYLAYYNPFINLPSSC